jgi:hypothetical protein
VIDQNVILTQLREGQEPEGVTVYHPPKNILIMVIVLIFCDIQLALSSTAFYGLMMSVLGDEKMIDSSLWPMYAHYPFLALPQLLLLFLLPYLVWRIEKRNRDMVLVMFPEGFIQYKPWQDERKCQAKMVAYANIQAIVRKSVFLGIALDISYFDGTSELVFLTTKEHGSLSVREQIINDWRCLNKLHQPSKEN